MEEELLEYGIDECVDFDGDWRYAGFDGFVDAWVFFCEISGYVCITFGLRLGISSIAYLSRY